VLFPFSGWATGVGEGNSGFDGVSGSDADMSGVERVPVSGRWI